MRLQISKSKNAKSFYIVESIYVDGKRSNKIFKKLGTEKKLKEKLGDIDVEAWAREQAIYYTKLYDENKLEDISIKFSQSDLIDKNNRSLYNIGFLFLQSIYYSLGLNDLCKDISISSDFSFDLNDILSKLIYARVISPSSKFSTYEFSKSFLGGVDFHVHDLYRALGVLSENSDKIQSFIYDSSSKIMDRNSKILYYDCTNFFFEIEKADGIKQYGISKEHRPNPIVQMGLFMDGDGIPLAFSINPGNQNEQLSLKPLEKKLLNDFKLSKFIVCTDAGLSSTENRKFNSFSNRAFITTQSIKKLKKFLKDWALDPTSFHLPNSNKLYDISKIDEEDFKDAIFYKSRWIKEDGLERNLIVTYSPKYKKYQRSVRQSQIDRATKAIDRGSSKIDLSSMNDFKRFIKKDYVTNDGEVADKKVFTLDLDAIKKEEMYDGFYACATNLEGDIYDIVKINKNRWEIEESFRIMKSEFKTRPVYLRREDRINAHFLTCFLALVVFRILEKILDNKYTCREIIDKLKEMSVLQKRDLFIPSYVRDDLSDDLHDRFNFRTDTEVISAKRMREIVRKTKRENIVQKQN